MRVHTCFLFLILASLCIGASGMPDTALRRLMDIQAFSTHGAEGMAYAKACEQALAESPDSPLRLDAYQRVGDIYYVQHRLPEMAKWYRKILEIDPSLEKTTPIGFRLSQHDRYSLRRNILFAVCGVYGLLFCFIFFNSLRNRRFFDLRYFLKTAGIWGAATVIAELLVLFKDAVLSSGIALKFTTQNASDMNMGLPAVPLSFLDSSNAMLAGIVLVIGLLPVLLVILYASFKKRSSRIVAGMIAVLSAGALWTHFIILTSYDRILDPVAYIVQKRVWFSGELEKMLITDPQKVLRANPVVLKSGNQDLEEFLRVNYPEGLPSGK